MKDVAPNMPDYETAYRNDRLDVPEYFNFGFDAKRVSQQRPIFL